MQTDPLKPLQEVIDQEHAEATHALAVLRRYLSHRGYVLEIRPEDSNGDPNPQTAPRPEPQPPKRNKPASAKQSFRTQVDQVIQSEFKTIAEISQLTGLDKKQVRGVIYSPILVDCYQGKKSPTGAMTFKAKTKLHDVFSDL